MGVWPQIAIIVNHVIRDRLLCSRHISILDPGDLFDFQASEKALGWRVILAVSTATQALRHPITPEALTQIQAGILATLIGMKHDVCWLAT